MATEFSWWSVVPTLVGGGISLATTFLMFGVAQSVDRSKRAKERKKEEAVTAFVGFWNLKALAEFLGNIDRELDEAFAQAGDEVVHLEPSDIIKGFLSADEVFPEFSIKELMFLSRQKQTQMIADVDLLLKRARNVEATIKKYTALREGVEAMLEDRASKIVETDAGRSQATLSGRDAVVVNLRRGNLNQILGGLHVLLERDVPESKRLTETYLELARKEYGSDFPDFKLEWVKPSANI